MSAGSLFSGIGGFDLALRDCGVNVIWQVEIDKACQSVLQKQFPGTEIFSDVKSVGKQNLEPVDIICGGFPCQDLSVAGQRQGLAGERSGLWFEFARVIEELRPGWVVIENVPGLLSSNRGRDFAVIIRGLAERGYGVAWRVLDAQYFGLAQRRKRVFIVGHLGDGRAAEVLFERESGCWNPAPRREKGEGVAEPITESFAKHHGASAGKDSYPRNAVIAFDAKAVTSKGNGECWLSDTHTSLSASGGGQAGQGYPAVIAFSADRDGSDSAENISPTLRHGGDEPEHHNAFRKMAIAFGGNNTSGEIDTATAVNAAPTRRYDFESEAFVATGWDSQRARIHDENGVAPSLQHGARQSGNIIPAIAYNIQHNDGGEHKRKDRPNGGLYVSETDTALAVGTTDVTAVATNRVGVRRLTPTECERLQGFPDGRMDGQSDSARYRQLGNAVAVPVVRWIIARIVSLEAIK